MTSYSHASTAAAPEAGWPAVGRLIRYTLGMEERGAKAPSVPEGYADWKQTVVPGLVAGVVQGGFMQWMEERQAGPPPFSLNMHLRRLFRVSDAALRGGLTIGSLAVLFFGVEAISSTHRGHRVFVLDGMYGGAAVGGAYALHTLHKAKTWPPPNTLPAILATILMLGVGQGLIQRQYHLQELENARAAAEAELERVRLERVAASAHSGTNAAAALMAQLEASLSGGGAARQQQQQEQQHGGQQDQQGQWQQEERQQGRWQQLEQQQEEQVQGGSEQQTSSQQPWWRWW